MTLSPDDINNHLNGMCKQLMYKRGMRNITLATDWLHQFERKPAVYILFDKRKNCLVYVGETASLRRRMRNLLQTSNHCIRRTIGKQKFSNVNGYKLAPRGKAFPLHIEKKINNYIEKHLKLSFLYVEIGRKELEELIVKKFNPELNKIGK